MRPLKVLLLFLGLSAGLPLAAVTRRWKVDFPSLGAVHFTATCRPLDSPGPYRHPRLRAECRGRALLDLEFDLGADWASELKLCPVRFKDFKDPLVFVLAAQPGGSDHLFQCTVLGLLDGSLQELLAERPQGPVQGAFVLGRFGRTRTPGLLCLDFLWEEGAHYQAHRYQARLFRWDGRAFVAGTPRETRGSHEAWQEAAKELGYRVDRDLAAFLLPDYK